MEIVERNTEALKAAHLGSRGTLKRRLHALGAPREAQGGGLSCSRMRLAGRVLRLSSASACAAVSSAPSTGFPCSSSRDAKLSATASVSACVGPHSSLSPAKAVRYSPSNSSARAALIGRSARQWARLAAARRLERWRSPSVALKDASASVSSGSASSVRPCA